MKDGILGIFKFFLFLLILPLVIASVLAFQYQVLAMPASKEQYFLWGAAVFVLAYLFIYNFKEVHVFGQSIIINLLEFMKASAQTVATVVPIYTILIVSVIFILNVLNQIDRYQGILLMALGFSAFMHIVLTAHQMYDADSNPIKAHYFLSFGLTLVALLIFISVLLNLAVPEYSFISFIKDFYSHASAYYHKIYKVLFVPS